MTPQSGNPHQRPRILLLSTAYLPMIGGSELAIHHIARRLPQYDFDLVTGRFGRGPSVETMGRVRVFRTGGLWTLRAFIFPKLLLPLAIAYRAWRLASVNEYQLVHVYQASQAAAAGFLFKLLRPRLPLLLTLQEGKNLESKSPFVRFLRGLLVRRADRLTAISTYLADYSHRVAPDTHVDIIPNGVDLELPPRPVRNPDPTIITVSRLVPKNNVESILRAFPLVREQIRNARLVIVGDGPLRDHLERLSWELGIREATHFTGLVSHEELPSWYSMADVFVRPSLSEGLGSAFLEAMAARVPIVGSTAGGIVDFLFDGVTGLVCDPRDPPTIAHAIVRTLTDRNLRQALTSNAYILIRERYTWDVVANQMASVYEQMR